MLVGVVEQVGVKDKKAFHTLYELWDILNPKKEKQTKQRKTDGNGIGKKTGTFEYPVTFTFEWYSPLPWRAQALT
jgi:hypothetical protein